MKKVKRVRASAKPGKMVGHEDVVLGLRSCPESPKAIVAFCSKTWGIEGMSIASLTGAPNPGVLRMRAANIVRGALTRAKRFQGEVQRVARAKK